MLPGRFPASELVPSEPVGCRLPVEPLARCLFDGSASVGLRQAGPGRGEAARRVWVLMSGGVGLFGVKKCFGSFGSTGVCKSGDGILEPSVV